MKAQDSLTETGRLSLATEPDGKMAALLASHPFVKDFDPHQRRMLADCAMEKSFEANEVIFCEGDPANRFYLILDGKVVLESYVLDRGRVEIQTIGAGDVLGWS